MTLKEYQNHLSSIIEKSLGVPTICEWNTEMDLNVYSPRPDVAVGPFSVINGENLINQYDTIFENNREIISKLVRCHLTNLRMISEYTSTEEATRMIEMKLHELKSFNYNSRCFIAIEIENKVSRKHLMGGAINASVLGRIGIAIGYTEEMHRAFLNLYRYFEFLQRVDKPNFRCNNLLIISKQQIIDIFSDKQN